MVTLTTAAAMDNGGIATTPLTTISRLSPSNDPVRQTVAFDSRAGDGRASSAQRTRSPVPLSTDPTTGFTTTARLGAENTPLRRSVPFDPLGAGVARRTPQTRSSFGVSLEQTTLIPGSYFRSLRGIAIDTDGNPLGDAKYIMAMGDLPTVGPVADDGTFTVYTLRSNYDDFVLVANSGREGVDYTWYTPVDVEIGPSENDVVLVFEPRKLTGLYAGPGTEMGGSLR
ncbi:hypothetical protein A6E15_02195 [Natrinema saccharevitans]|uniref:Uncharacterized protein n=2 Tax=Natrinema saccharevitans TaxID=301967 RepID=A0A1S8ATU6_9EURY|nr:hypothetical protein A6E15_02195 [Natrinema saccharevitans]